MPTPRPRNSNPDARPTTGGQRRREAGWRADDRAQAESNREHERRRREVKKAGWPRKVQPSRRRAPLPLDLLASALEAGVSERQIAQALGISRFDLNRALQQETVRVALDRGEADRPRAPKTAAPRGCCSTAPAYTACDGCGSVGPSIGVRRRARASRRRPRHYAVHDHPRPAARRRSRCR